MGDYFQIPDGSLRTTELYYTLTTGPVTLPQLLNSSIRPSPFSLFLSINQQGAHYYLFHHKFCRLHLALV
jgi:hypothetical protein